MIWNLLAWGVLVIVLLMIEGATAGLTTIWFAGGAVVALIATALDAPYWLQAVLFLAVSVALLACLRPFVRKYVTPKKTRTNADRMLGMQVLVTEQINNLAGTGAVKIGGVEWTARAAGADAIAVGTLVQVQSIEGVKVYVEPVEAPVQKKGEVTV